MTAYQDRPTLVLPGTGGTVSGTAVNNWLDEDGNPKYGNDEGSPAARGESAEGETTAEEQTRKDKAFNEAVLKAAKEGQGAKAGDEDNAEASEDDRGRYQIVGASSWVLPSDAKPPRPAL